VTDNWMCAMIRKMFRRPQHSLPMAVREASHELANAAAAAQGTAIRLKREVDVLAALAEAIRREVDERGQ
jgi:hypothetical protein